MKVVTICSVKGGTGKTLIALNLAHELSRYGKTGLIDADIDSSNVAEFIMPKGGTPIQVDKDKKFKLYNWNGVKIWSMSLTVEKWRPISMTEDRHVQIIADVLQNSDWGNIDYMVVDLPSGASDVFKSMIYLFAKDLVGSIIVIQPAFYDNAKRVIRLHQVNEIPIIGLIENMAYFEYKNIKFYIFGKPIGEKLKEEFNINYLGSIPLSIEIRENIERGIPILPDKYIRPISTAAKIISEIREVGILDKLRTKLTGLIKSQVEKVLAHFIILVNKEISIKELQEKYGFTHGKIFDLVITDEFGQKVITRIHMRVKEGKLVVLKNPGKVDFEIVTDFKTLARVFMGKRKVNGDVEPYDIWDAWLNGYIRIYGIGSTPMAMYAIRNLFENPEVVNNIREKYGNILSKFI